MFTLPDNVNEFNNKYYNSIGYLIYKYYSKKNERDIEVSAPFKVRCIEGGLEGVTLFGQLLSPTVNDWVQKEIPVDNIKSLEFPFPYNGFVHINGYLPVFVSRNHVKQYHKGWSSHTLDIQQLSLFIRFVSAVESPFNVIKSAADCNLVKFCFMNQTLKRLSEINKEEDSFALLSSNFLGANIKGNWILYYNNYIVGTLFPFYLEKEAEFLEDLFLTSVLE